MTPSRPGAGQRAPRPNRNDAVQQQIKQLILGRNLVPGDVMPTESARMAELGIGRDSVREALKALQALGIIGIRHGFGMYVSELSLAALVDGLTFRGRLSLHEGHNQLMELAEARELMELGLLERAIKLHTTETLTALGAIADRMDAEAARGTVSVDTDRAFHEQLHEPLANPFLGQLFGVFWDVYHELQHALPAVKDDAAAISRRHRDLYLAIAAGDRIDLIEAATRHFDGIRHRLSPPVSPDPPPQRRTNP